MGPAFGCFILQSCASHLVSDKQDARALQVLDSAAQATLLA